MNPLEMLSPAPTQSSDPIPLIAPEIRGNEWKYVKECLDTNWVSSVGSYVDRFEKMVARFLCTELSGESPGIKERRETHDDDPLAFGVLVSAPLGVGGR